MAEYAVATNTNAKKLKVVIAIEYFHALSFVVSRKRGMHTLWAL